MKKNSKISLLSKFFLFINSIAVICLLLSYLATVANPVDYSYLAFFGLGYPFFLLANILFILYWAIRRRWYLLISLTVILLGYGFLTSTFAFRTKAASNFETDSATIKLMTYNAHHFKKFGLELDSSTKSGILQMINDEQPDIIGVQEFFTRRKGKYDIKDSMFKILDTKRYHYDTTAENDYESSGVAVFSKYPIINKGGVALEDSLGGNRCIWIDVKKNEKAFRVYIVHLASISFQPEDYNYLSKLKTKLNTDEDMISGKRIIDRLKKAFIKRSYQVKKIKDHTASCNTPYIIMGDFNDTPVSYTLSQLTEKTQNGFKEKGSGLGITYNGEFPNFQIDYILATSHFNFKGYKILKKSFSDHYPVRCNVTLAD